MLQASKGLRPFWFVESAKLIKSTANHCVPHELENRHSRTGDILGMEEQKLES